MVNDIVYVYECFLVNPPQRYKESPEPSFHFISLFHRSSSAKFI